MHHPHVPPEVVELDTTFRSIDAGDGFDGRVLDFFSTAWPAYRRWYLNQGEAARPSYAECSQMLRLYMPELAPTYDRLVEAVGGGDLEARFLSHWRPPPLFAACSLLTYTRERNVLLRNYDYPPLLCDNTVLASSWHGSRVMAMTDCLWGALDGVNEHGLSVAIAFGGRPVVGDGFGIGLVVRYLLEFATNVDEAVAMLHRIPLQLTYNIALVDASGRGAIVYVAPDREPVVSGAVTAANRQGPTAVAGARGVLRDRAPRGGDGRGGGDAGAGCSRAHQPVSVPADPPLDGDQHLGNGLHGGLRRRPPDARAELARRPVDAVTARLRGGRPGAEVARRGSSAGVRARLPTTSRTTHLC